MKFLIPVLLLVFMFSACSRTSLPKAQEKINRDPVSVQPQKSPERSQSLPQPIQKPQSTPTKLKGEDFVFNPSIIDPLPPIKYSYTYEDLKVGAKVGPWKVTKIEQPITTMPLSKDNFQVTFDREVYIEGSYVYYPEGTPFRRLSLCFFPSSKSMLEMPVFKDVDRRGEFCFSNKEDFIETLSLSEGDSGEAKIIISSYTFMVAPMEGGYGAVFKKLQQ